MSVPAVAVLVVGLVRVVLAGGHAAVTALVVLARVQVVALVVLARFGHGASLPHRELLALPGGMDRTPPNGIAVPLRLRSGDEVLSFLSTVTTFGTAVDLTAAELSIEAFLPADEATAAALRR